MVQEWNLILACNNVAHAFRYETRESAIQNTWWRCRAGHLWFWVGVVYMVYDWPLETKWLNIKSLLSFVSIAKQSDDTSMLHTVCGSPLYVGKHTNILTCSSYSHKFIYLQLLKSWSVKIMVLLWIYGLLGKWMIVCSCQKSDSNHVHVYIEWSLICCKPWNWGWRCYSSDTNWRIVHF